MLNSILLLVSAYKIKVNKKLLCLKNLKNFLFQLLYVIVVQGNVLGVIMRVFVLFVFSFCIGVNSTAMEQQQFPKEHLGVVCSNSREELMVLSGNTLIATSCHLFYRKWLGDEDLDMDSSLIATKKDGCIVGFLMNKKKVVTAKCDSWLKMLIDLDPVAEVTFSADAVMFLDGKFGRHRYTQTFKNMYGSIEFTLPLAEGCNIAIDYTGDEINTQFTLIPMNVSNLYSE